MRGAIGNDRAIGTIPIPTSTTGSAGQITVVVIRQCRCPRVRHLVRRVVGVVRHRRRAAVERDGLRKAVARAVERELLAAQQVGVRRARAQPRQIARLLQSHL
ncbi:MAG: hypothetical protein SF123_11660 [Chloroflexota bacterium]|nr:hypothetical protein [Chloroflexota bacterium]